MRAVLLILLALLATGSGCQKSRESLSAIRSAHPVSSTASSNIYFLAVYVWIEEYTPIQKATLVDDQLLIRSLYEDLQKTPPQPVRCINFDAPRIFAFFNARMEVVRAYHYSTACDPDPGFRPIEVKKVGALLATGPTLKIGNGDPRNRIVIPDLRARLATQPGLHWVVPR